ncbi:putative two component sensor domain protein, partial [Vibrio parahaemolyticus V-223/04]
LRTEPTALALLRS